MSEETPPTPDPEKVARAEAAEAAVLEADQAAAAALMVLQRAREEAAARHAEAYAELEAWRLAQAQADFDRHLHHCHTVRAHCHAHVDPETIEVATIDGAVHRVVAREALLLGHKGHGDDCRDSVRFTFACGLAVDTPCDELTMDRFAQGAPVSCAHCEDV